MQNKKSTYIQFEAKNGCIITIHLNDIYVNKYYDKYHDDIEDPYIYTVYLKYHHNNFWEVSKKTYEEIIGLLNA